LLQRRGVDDVGSLPKLARGPVALLSGCQMHGFDRIKGDWGGGPKHRDSPKGGHHQ
jgi:hypothetical protein